MEREREREEERRERKAGEIKMDTMEGLLPGVWGVGGSLESVKLHVDMHSVADWRCTDRLN